MGDDYDFHESFTFNLRLRKAEFPSIVDNSPPPPPQPVEINFKFSFKFRTSEWIVRDREPRLARRYSDPETDHLVRLSGYQFSSFEETQKYVEEQLLDLPVMCDDRRRLVDHALETASEIIKVNYLTWGSSHRVLNLQLGAVVDHEYIFYLEGEEVDHDEYSSFRMTPAVDSSIEALKTVECSGRNVDVGCSICLEDVFSGDGGGCSNKEALSMPCSHVFHGDCIKQWLMTSHYCPLCRFELPTIELDK